MRVSVSKQVDPFLKWAGGKRWFVPHAVSFVPNFEGTYFEPFLGSGAMFFHLQPVEAVLADANSELIGTYQSLKNDWSKVVGRLGEHHRKHSKEYYYQVRASKPWSEHGKAAKFIYLNRTCWNGLYRVNLKGEFNVPIGTKKNVIIDSDRFDLVSNLLQNVHLLSGDFEDVVNMAGQGDFVFVDPPYTVKHNTNGFIKYNEKLFSWEDQERLKACIDKAVARGAKVLVTNADHESIRDLYHGYQQVQMDRLNVLSGKAEYRGRYNELIILCGYYTQALKDQHREELTLHETEAS